MLWTQRFDNGGFLSIDTEKLSHLLEVEGRPLVDAIAGEAAAIAANTLPPNDRRFIGVKYAKEFALKSGSIRSSLSRRLEVPVALVTNDSNFAVQQEAGSVSHPNRVPPRPLLTAWSEMKRRRGIRGVRNTDNVVADRNKFRNLSRVNRLKGRRTRKGTTP